MKIDLANRTKEKAEMLKRMQENPRISAIRLAAPADCPLALTIQGTYDKGSAPQIPRKECSRPGGCICTYEPVLNTIHP